MEEKNEQQYYVMGQNIFSDKKTSKEIEFIQLCR